VNSESHEAFRFGRTGTAVLLLPTRPREQQVFEKLAKEAEAHLLLSPRQRYSTLMPADLLSLTGDQDAVWPILEAVRRLDRQTFEEWVLAIPQREAHGVTSSMEEEEVAVGRCDDDLDANPTPLRAPHVEASFEAKIAIDPIAPVTRRQIAFERVLSRVYDADLTRIGQAVVTALRRFESLPERKRVLEGAALTGYWHLAARLGQSQLDDWCEDDQGKKHRLRVCQLTGRIFRARRGTQFHPCLPPEPVQALIGDHHVGAFLGPLWEPLDPFSAAARAPRFYAACQECGDLFTSATSSKRYCTLHDLPAARKRRSRRRAAQVVERR
jgi:hypothetical protein